MLILEWVYSISKHFSVLAFTITKKWYFVPIQVILVFFANEILVLIWNFMQSEKNFLQNWKLQIVLSGVSGTSVNVLSQAVWFFHLNAVQTSLWNKSHSWRKGIPLSYKQLLRSHARGPMANVSLKKICTVSRSHTMDRDKPHKLLFTHSPLNCN